MKVLISSASGKMLPYIKKLNSSELSNLLYVTDKHTITMDVPTIETLKRLSEIFDQELIFGSKVLTETSIMKPITKYDAYAVIYDDSMELE